MEPLRILKRSLVAFAAGAVPLALLDAFLFHRYRVVFRLGPFPVGQFLVLFSAAYLMALASVIRTGEALNPLSLYSVFALSYAFSRLPLSGMQATASTRAQVVVLLAVVSFVAGALLYDRRTEASAPRPPAAPSKPVALVAVALLSAASFVWEIASLGYVPVFHLFGDRNVYEEMNASAIPFVHYLVLASALLPAWAYVYLRRGAIRKRAFAGIVAMAVFITGNFLSRQGFLLLSLSTFLAFHFYGRFSNAAKAAFAIFCAVTFLVVGAVRLSQASDAEHGDYLIAFGNIEYETSLAEGWLVSYVSLPFSRLDELVADQGASGRMHLGKYLLRPLGSLLFLEKLGVVEYEPDTTKSVSTYLADPYLDLSFLGVIVFNLALGLYAMHAFTRFELHHDDAIVTWALVAFCLIMSPFVNFANTFLVWFLWFLNWMLTAARSHPAPAASAEEEAARA